MLAHEISPRSYNVLESLFLHHLQKILKSSITVIGLSGNDFILQIHAKHDHGCASLYNLSPYRKRKILFTQQIPAKENMDLLCWAQIERFLLFRLLGVATWNRGASNYLLLIKDSAKTDALKQHR
ncbi:hypothetical protein TNIN_163011 [Trichonephila inaurata madagascariensis]|uniref:Uncharacterized protein n=1 Tax=Trichonephila inaurata madagascariensis TaxID=2747483 RepID=A0A8X7CEX1_9ARAC|nr:hypothetical protein TNIN_163011 [Trichonephila inaurata madagascariensis]